VDHQVQRFAGAVRQIQDQVLALSGPTDDMAASNGGNRGVEGLQATEGRYFESGHLETC
jgi:hypothetical protein